MDVLNEDPGGSPADAIGTNFAVAAIWSRSEVWHFRLEHSASNDGGRLWVPHANVDLLLHSHPYLRINSVAATKK
jgi:hypothetical protein